MEKSLKSEDLLQNVRQSVTSGRLIYSNHANDRMLERRILKVEIEYVLRIGFHHGIMPLGEKPSMEEI